MIDSVARSVAANGLDTLTPLEPVALSGAEVRDLMRVATRHRLVGLVAGAVADGLLLVDDDGFDFVAGTHESWCAHVLSVERLLVEVARQFDEDGIALRLFKGSALALGSYADPSRRLFADIDLLVASDDFERATLLIENRLGGKRALPELRPGFDREFGKENLVRVGRIEVDLHRTIAAGPIGLAIPRDELMNGPAGSVVVAGREVPTLGPTAQFIQVCVNAAVGDYPARLLSLRDVAEVASALEADPANVESVAQRWRALAAVKRAVELTWQELELAPSTWRDWAATVQPSRVDSLLMRSYLTSARSYTRPAASLLVIPGVAGRARYLRAIAWPQAEYLNARGWSQSSHTRRAFDRVMRRR